jgi:ubiquinone/menaquinone biosynthesis C-methylase UbiE
MGEQSGWQLGSVSVAEACERYMMSAFGNAWGQDLVEVAAPSTGQRVLDLACGTGAVARAAASRVGATGHVVGLDLNPAMLAMARAMAHSDGPPIEWREGDAMALPFAEATFDLVCCHQGLQFFPDRSAALRDMRRVLVPGGRLALGVWRRLEHQPFYAALTDALERYVSTQAAASLRAAFTLGDGQTLRALVADAGFREIHIRIRSRITRWPLLEDYVFGYLAGSPMAPAVAALDDTARNALLEHITTLLASYVDDDGLAAPWESHVVTARA